MVFYRDDDGTVPMLDWLDKLPAKVVAKCLVRIGRLKELGHEPRRPEADLLRDGTHELQVGFGGQNYRMLHFYHKNVAAILSHGLTKERAVPPLEIDRAVARSIKFEKGPAKHTHEEPASGSQT